MIIAVAIIQVPIFARLLRGRCWRNGSRTDHVLAARALGVKKRAIVFRHVLPNSMAPVIVQATLVLATAIIDAAALSLPRARQAHDPPARVGPDAGRGAGLIDVAPAPGVLPGLRIIVVALGFTLLGESLREAIDPKTGGDRDERQSGRRPAGRRGRPCCPSRTSVQFTRQGDAPFKAVDGVTFDR